MQESGGRRIKRWVNIDMTSIKFCSPEMLKKFRNFQYISLYVEDKEEEIKKYNEGKGVNPEYTVNGRRQTNIGIFRAYLIRYLQNRQDINPEMNLIVRQLQPAENGLPIEIYCFSKEKEFDEYESIQADIFDHILAVIPEFDLRIFQNPTGQDYRSS